MVSTYSIVTEKNCEALCVKELKERFNVEGIPRNGFVDFKADNELALRVTYFSQCAKYLLLKIGNGSFDDLDDLISKIKEDLNNSDVWSSLLSATYKVSCSRQGIHDFNSVVVEQESSGVVKKIIANKGLNVSADYKSKELVFFVYIEDNNYLFGIDYAGKDLSKRHYLFFNNPIAIKGNVAFNLLLFADYKPGKVLLDCFALAGVIPIEAAIYEKNSSIHSFSKEFFFPQRIKKENEELLKKLDSEIGDKKKNNIFSCDSSFPNLAAQKKNSRIAGVEKNISFSRTDTKNLDIKNFGKEIDLVCSRIIESSKKVPESVVIRAYNDFFSAAKEFLKKDGSINIIIREPTLLKEIALKHGFKMREELLTAQGQQDFFFVKLIR